MTWYIKIVNGIPQGGPQDGALLEQSIPGLDLTHPNSGYEPVNRDLQTQPHILNFASLYEIEIQSAIEMVDGVWTMVRKKRAMNADEKSQKEIEIASSFQELINSERQIAVEKETSEIDPELKVAWQQRILDLDNWIIDLSDPNLPALPKILQPSSVLPT